MNQANHIKALGWAILDTLRDCGYKWANVQSYIDFMNCDIAVQLTRTRPDGIVEVMKLNIPESELRYESVANAVEYCKRTWPQWFTKSIAQEVAEHG